MNLKINTTAILKLFSSFEKFEFVNFFSASSSREVDDKEVKLG